MYYIHDMNNYITSKKFSYLNIIFYKVLRFEAGDKSPRNMAVHPTHTRCQHSKTKLNVNCRKNLD